MIPGTKIDIFDNKSIKKMLKIVKVSEIVINSQILNYQSLMRVA